VFEAGKRVRAIDFGKRTVDEPPDACGKNQNYDGK
jgi:hypothetical protein